MSDKLHGSKVPLYGIDIYYSNNPDLVLRHFEQDGEHNLAGFCCYDHIDRSIGIHIPHEKGAVAIPLLCHEVFHAAMQVGDYVGLEPTLNANEEIAYIITWVSGWVLECIDKDCKNKAKQPEKRKKE